MQKLCFRAAQFSHLKKLTKLAKIKWHDGILQIVGKKA